MEPLFHLVKSETVDLTPELAMAFRDMPASPTERELRPDRIKRLREKAERGELITFNWSTAKLADVEYRMNGQHSSHMLCDLNGSFPPGLKAHRDTYEVANEIGLTALFRQFDDRKSGRDAHDVAGAYQGIMRALRGVDKGAVKLGTEGVAWWRRHVEGVPVGSGDDIYILATEPGLSTFLIWCGDLFTIKTPELKRAPIAAAAYANFIAGESDAKKFWNLVARGGAEFADTDPTTVLDGWLKSIKDDPPVGKRKLQPGNFYQGCVFAWNAFRQGKTITEIKHDIKKGLSDVL